MVGMMWGLKHLQLVPSDQGAVAISTKLDPWIRTWWGESLNSLSAKYWFEQNRDDLLLGPPPATVDTVLEILLGSMPQRPYKSHMMVVPRLMKFS